MIFIFDLKIALPKSSFKKLTPRAIEEPLIAPAKCPSKLEVTRRSKITGAERDVNLCGLILATTRSPAVRPIFSGLSKSEK